MKRTILFVGLTVVATASLAFEEHEYTYARVIKVDPKYVTVYNDVCEKVYVQTQARDSSPAGALIGGVAGGDRSLSAHRRRIFY